tara:strand:- start:322 stop:534 length:213 start_codon:yes stop_codon:yes gene_type:complete
MADNVNKQKEVTKEKLETTNPFNKGVSYADFLENVKDKVTEKILIDNLNLDKKTKEWLEKDLKQYKINKK